MDKKIFSKTKWTIVRTALLLLLLLGIVEGSESRIYVVMVEDSSLNCVIV